MSDSEKVSVELIAADGQRLAATLLNPAGIGPPTVIAPATAVPARFYGRFATYVAARGRPTLTFDYRGQGGSAPPNLKGSPIRFRDWGILDIPAAIDAMTARYPGQPLHWIGHSYGGFGTGLAHNNRHIGRLFGFASVSADVRLMPARGRYGSVPQFLAGTILARALGYLPAGLISTEPMAKGAMLEWYQFCTTKDFVFGVKDLPEVRHFETLSAAVRLSIAADDHWVSPKAAAHLLAHMPAARDKSTWLITAEDAGGKALGHTGFFRGEHRETLWPRALSWLDADALAPER